MDLDNAPLKVVDGMAVGRDNKRLVIKRGFVTTATAEDKKHNQNKTASYDSVTALKSQSVTALRVFFVSWCCVVPLQYVRFRQCRLWRIAAIFFYSESL